MLTRSRVRSQASFPLYTERQRLDPDVNSMTYLDKRYATPGTPPGDLTPHIEGAAPRLHLAEYGASFWYENADATVEACAGFIAAPTYTWIHVQGAVSPQVLRELGAAFGVHPLALEDILHTGQRPKLENYGGPLFAVLSWPRWRDERAATEQVSVFFDERLVISFHAGESDPFEPVRVRLRDGAGKIREQHADFVFHSLIDLVIDQGFPILDECAAWIEQLEEQLLDKPRVTVLHDLHELRRDIGLLRRMLWPHREIVNALLRDTHPLIGADTRLYLRDCYDHTVQVIEILEMFRENSTSMMELYLSTTSNRLNDIMRVLTIMATLFIPPTFVVGVYGMNFERMPELRWEYGYPLVWMVIAGMIGGMLYYFKRKDWF